MNNQISQNQPHKQVWPWLIIGIIIFFFIIAIFSQNKQTSVPLTNNGQINTIQNQPINNQILPLTITCTNFKYSEWSSCNEDEQQYRTITEMYPPGCTGGNPIQSQKCEYKPTNIGTAPEILDRIISQIRTAPNQTINSSYISGENGEMLQNLSYQILDDFLVIKSTLVHRNTNIAESTVDFIDSDLDGFVDYWAGTDRVPHAIDKNSQEYSQIQTIWGVYLINFANHHLVK